MDQQAESPGMRSFGFLWAGQLISSFGSALTGFGISVYLYEATGSAFQFALNTFFYVAIIGCFSFVAGALVDRWNRRRTLLLADSGLAVISLLIAWWAFQGVLAVWMIYLLTIADAVLRTFQSLAYDASIALLVPKRQLSRAAGMGQINRAFSELLAPTAAGVLVVAIGLEGVALLDFATFIVSLATLLFIRIPNPEMRHVSSRGGLLFLKQDISTGWKYLLERPGLLGLNIVSYANDFFVNCALILTIPLVLTFANATEAGLVVTIGGVGLLLGSLVISIRGGFKNRARAYLYAVMFGGIAFIIMGWRPDVAVVALGRFLFFLSFSVAVGTLRPILQSKVSPGVQGRVFGTIGAISMLTEAPAYPVSGFLAEEVFEPLMNKPGMSVSMIGQVIGAGPGRGMGLLSILMGICILFVGIFGFINSKIRNLEEEIPDVVS